MQQASDCKQQTAGSKRRAASSNEPAVIRKQNAMAAAVALTTAAAAATHASETCLLQAALDSTKTALEDATMSAAQKMREVVTSHEAAIHASATDKEVHSTPQSSIHPLND